MVLPNSLSSYYEKFLATGEVKCIDEEIPFEIPQGWEWCRFGSLMINRDSERIPLSVAQRQTLKKVYDYYGASGVIDKVDNYFAKLVFPFDSDEFKRNFYILMCQPKWRTSQKGFSAIQANLNGLSKYPEEFALILIKESISKGWAALEYDSTPEKYEKWEKMKRSVKTEQQSSKEIADMMKYLNNDFD